MIWKGRRGKWSWPSLKPYPDICFRGLRKSTNNVRQRSRSPGRDLKPEPVEYEAGALPTRQYRSVSPAPWIKLHYCQGITSRLALGTERWCQSYFCNTHNPPCNGLAGGGEGRSIFARSKAGIVGSNPTWGMVVCVRLFCVCVVLCVNSGLATGRSLVQGVLPAAYRLGNWESGNGPQGLLEVVIAVVRYNGSRP
jgi:hypothetical protein